MSGKVTGSSARAARGDQHRDTIRDDRFDDRESCRCEDGNRTNAERRPACRNSDGSGSLRRSRAEEEGGLRKGKLLLQLQVFTVQVGTSGNLRL